MRRLLVLPCSSALTASALAPAPGPAVASTGDRWQNIIGAGIFRLRDTQVTREWISHRKAESTVLFYKDSADATVSVPWVWEMSKQTITRGTVLSSSVSWRSYRASGARSIPMLPSSFS